MVVLSLQGTQVPTSKSRRGYSECNSFPIREEISQLREELPVYVANLSGIDSSVNILDWWRNNSQELRIPHWSSAKQRVFLIHSSSVAAEQVFSILNSTFTDHQTNSLEDYIEVTVMLHYNK